MALYLVHFEQITMERNEVTRSYLDCLFDRQLTGNWD